MQANQCATSAKPAMSRKSTAAPYSEYLSSLRATLTSRRSLAVLSKVIISVVCSGLIIQIANHVSVNIKNTLSRYFDPGSGQGDRKELRQLGRSETSL